MEQLCNEIGRLTIDNLKNIYNKGRKFATVYRVFIDTLGSAGLCPAQGVYSNFEGLTANRLIKSTI